MHMVHGTSLAAVDLNLLVVLRALLSERHVTRAASRVGLSQSATSHALSRLRELYDDPLLVRSGRSLELTPRAQRLLPTLERGLSDLKAAIDGEPEFEPATARRTFTLGMADYNQAVMLGPLLRTLEHEAPHVDLELVNLPNLEELVDTGHLDLGLTLSGRPAPTQLSSQTLFEDDFVCMVRQGHPKVGKKLSLEQYLSLRHVVVAPSGTSGSLVDTELERRGFKRRVALRISNFLVAPVVVHDTDFVSTMPQRLARTLAAPYGLRLLPAPIELPKFGLSLIWHPRLEHDPAQRWLRELVTRVSALVSGASATAKPRRPVAKKPGRK
jgi:DNA-binding transcriptional LysR family regulator